MHLSAADEHIAESILAVMNPSHQLIAIVRVM